MKNQYSNIFFFTLFVLGSIAQAQIVSFTQTGNNVTLASQRQGFVCSNGSYWSAQACLQCKTILNGYCQCASYGGCSTVVCQNGNINVGTLAAPNCQQICDPNCLKCAVSNFAQVCQGCASGYQLVGGVCIQLNGCSQYDEQTAQCQTCTQGTFYDWSLYTLGQMSTCTNCMPSCSKCGSQSTCAQCNTGYYWGAQNSQVPSSCLACSQGCTSCTNNTQCVTCASTAFLSNTTNTATCTQCNAKLTNCIACTNSTSCTQCANNNLIINGVCQVCSPSCQTCSNSTTCTTCQSGYVLNGGNCLTCPSNCNSCSNNNGTAICTSCADTYYLQSTTNCQACNTSPNSNWLRCAGPLDTPSMNTTQPTQCVDRQWLVQVPSNQSNTTLVNQCVSISTNNLCLNILTSDNTQCSSCFPGYNVYNKLCYLCPASCSSCNLTPPNGQNYLTCNTCNNGYYSDNTQQCQSCSKNCAVCSSNSICSACQSGFYLFQASCTACSINCAQCDQNGCKTCNSQAFFMTFQNVTYLNATANTTSTYQQCELCSSDCATCSSAKVCSSCPATSQLSGTGCVALTPNACLKFSAAGVCALCNYGTYLKAGRCLRCVDQATGFVCRNNTYNTPSASTKYASIMAFAGMIVLLVIN